MSDMRTYKAIVWPGTGDLPGERLIIQASDLDDAERQLKQQFGEDIRFSLYNEEDADKPR